MEIVEKKYVLQVADLGDFDLDDDRSIDSSIAFELKQAGIPAKVHGNEFTRDTVEIETSATLDELKKVFQDADLPAEIDMKEDEQYVRTGPGHFKQDDFVSSVKKAKKFKYVSAKQGDNALADEDQQTKTNEAEEKLYTELKEEYSKFVKGPEEKKKTEKSGLGEGDQEVKSLMRDQSAVFSKYKSEFENNVKKIQDPAQLKTSQGAPFSMSDMILKKGIDSTFRLGRGRANFGKVVPISQDVDATLTSVKRATGSIGGVLQVDVDTVEKLQDLLTRVPSGEPFANMEDLIVTQADVYHFMAVKNLVLDILRGQATATRLGGLGGALKTAAGDIARAAGVEQ